MLPLVRYLRYMSFYVYCSGSFSDTVWGALALICLDELKVGDHPLF